MACFPGLGSSSRSIERIGTEIGDLEQCGQPQLQPVSRCGTRLLDLEARHLTQQLVLTARNRTRKKLETGWGSFDAVYVAEDSMPFFPVLSS